MELDRDECLRLLASATRGYLGMNRNALPAIFPIRFSLEGKEVVFSLATLRGAIAGNVVCVYAEGDGWSVSVTGQALVEGERAYISTDMISGERYSAASLAQ